jgi:hypothetical protein
MVRKNIPALEERSTTGAMIIIMTMMLNMMAMIIWRRRWRRISIIEIALVALILRRMLRWVGCVSRWWWRRVAFIGRWRWCRWVTRWRLCYRVALWWWIRSPVLWRVWVLRCSLVVAHFCGIRDSEKGRECLCGYLFLPLCIWLEDRYKRRNVNYELEVVNLRLNGLDLKLIILPFEKIKMCFLVV